ALLSGRARWTSDDMPWAAIGVGALLTAAIVAIHPIIFGGNPLVEMPVPNLSLSEERSARAEGERRERCGAGHRNCA
ncbi:hypothetical protein, partial [Candidatus Binatus sp.]|uniref:hypothetical protein n=1 Tax=Candidatus Binatus sp. TaxID=2811406 RepID=UPI003C77CE79